MPSSLPPAARRALGGLGAGLCAGLLAGGALAAYGVVEAQRFTLREARVPLLPPGHAPLRLLHLTDLHLLPGQRRKQDWVRDLATLRPDLVVDTGDNLAHRDALGPLLDALEPFAGTPGAFVLGSNDYFSPTPRNPLRYLLPDDGRRHVHTPQLPWRGLVARLRSWGWVDLGNASGTLQVGATRFALAGVDDPHLGYDRLDAVPAAASVDAEAHVRLGVAHAPYLRVLDAFVAQGYDAVLAGHTHGGQVCLPGGRALTTNCDLEPARAKGLHRHPAGSRQGDPGSAWLHVSAGLGTNPWTPVRIACRPEATLLTLDPLPATV